MIISYAQNQEDILLNRVFQGQSEGFYIDVGANDPVVDSVTKLFHDRGWTGINIEPDEDCWQRLEQDRPLDRNLNLGISDTTGVLTYHAAENAGGWSTFSDAQAEELRRRGFHVQSREVPVTTLADICARFVGDRTIDFLKIDVESHEAQVISGADWGRWRPRVVLVEANAEHLWEPWLTSANYQFATFDGLNRYYVRGEDADSLKPRFCPPVNVLDEFLPYRYHLAFEELREQARVMQEIGPTTLAVARGLRRAADWVPGLTRLARSRVRRAG